MAADKKLCLACAVKRLSHPDDVAPPRRGEECARCTTLNEDPYSAKRRLNAKPGVFLGLGLTPKDMEGA